MDKQERKEAQAEFEAVCAVLKRRNWQCKKDDENLEVGFISEGKNMPLSVNMKVNPELKTVTAFVHLPFELPEGKDEQFAIATALLNEEVIHGNFEVDFAARRMYFRMSTSYRNSLMDKEAYFYLIAVAFSTVDGVAAGIKTLCDGKITVEQILAKVGGAE